jgi:hypothetical protein
MDEGKLDGSDECHIRRDDAVWRGWMVYGNITDRPEEGTGIWTDIS